MRKGSKYVNIYARNENGKVKMNDIAETATRLNATKNAIYMAIKSKTKVNGWYIDADEINKNIEL